MGQALGGANLLGVIQLDALCGDELDEPFAVTAHVALDFVQRGQLFAFGLSNVENIHAPKTVQRSLSLLGIGVLFRILFSIAFVADHWG